MQSASDKNMADYRQSIAMLLAAANVDLLKHGNSLLTIIQQTKL